MGRKNAEGSRIDEIARYLRQAADRRVLRNRVEVVKVETVVEMVYVAASNAPRMKRPPRSMASSMRAMNRVRFVSGLAYLRGIHDSRSISAPGRENGVVHREPNPWLL